MMDRLIAILIKHNPQTRIEAAIVVVELLTAMREPTEKQYNALCATDTMWRELNSLIVWQRYIDAVIND